MQYLSTWSEFQVLHQSVREDGSYSITDLGCRSRNDLCIPSITCNVTGDEYDLLPDIDSLRPARSKKLIPMNQKKKQSWFLVCSRIARL